MFPIVILSVVETPRASGHDQRRSSISYVDRELVRNVWITGREICSLTAVSIISEECNPLLVVALVGPDIESHILQITAENNGRVALELKFAIYHIKGENISSSATLAL